MMVDRFGRTRSYKNPLFTLASRLALFSFCHPKAQQYPAFHAAPFSPARYRNHGGDPLKRFIVILFLFVIPWAFMEPSRSHAAAPKVLFVNSYHQGYKWSDDIEKGFLKALNVDMVAGGSLDPSRSGVAIKIFRMDTKRNASEESKRNAALAAKQIIEKWRPDVVVTSDDNAAKYLIVPYFKKAPIPFVFCGLNWDASNYGFPVFNVTGMVEVAPLVETLEILRTYARGNRVGYIGADVFTNRQTLPHHTRVLGIHYSDGKLVSTFDEWVREYTRLQDTVDILILLNCIGIRDWDRRQALDVILEATKIPSGCEGDNSIDYVLLARTKIAEEQGWWAGKTALRILAGTPPADIPIVKNQQSRLYLNMPLAARLKIKFPMELIQQATFVGEDTEKQP